MIDFVSSAGPEKGIAALAEKIAGCLNEEKKVLWLIAGGSNVPIATAVMAAVRDRTRRTAKPEALAHLTVSQTDERYGPVGHADSNWQQMIEAGFDFDGIKTVPILHNEPLDATVKEWSKEIEEAFTGADVVIAQFGMGADGHIAGMLPHSPTIHEKEPAASHTDEKFTRITLAPPMLKRIATAFAFVYGDAKRKAVRDLHDKDMSLDEEPAQILKIIPEAHLYTDCL